MDGLSSSIAPSLVQCLQSGEHVLVFLRDLNQDGHTVAASYAGHTVRILDGQIVNGDGHRVRIE